MTTERIDIARTAATPPVSDVLAGLAAVGPFFELLDVTEERADGRSVRPFAAVLAPDALLDRVERTRVGLGAEPPLGRRIAASIAVQGLAAKLLSGPVAALALHGVLVDLRPETLWWSATPLGDVVALDPPRVARCPFPAPDALAPLVDDVLTPLVEIAGERFGVSGTVLWGNVASSVAGAKRVLDIQRPDAADAVAAVAADLLEHPRLTGTGERRAPVAPDHAWTFRRRSCCLYYRVPGGSTCADCVLADLRGEPASGDPTD
ncbi:(2Fe-2S)-binding protein [Pseudonocardia sp. McavD-2-B]|uniref:(2Fe-2S)-binding protein n=1 Tax=Pseudonocardia sp. McavD-2-B TaxID=2954499 RepID=UPI002097699A|nr:(2Fe-2S)-binding protein [Pseudonocardia sp. McavD-2-B]MCO7195057.1 (2Fe-2S)-binding protein [Pseudonocardia sp. McavD-2-B]